MIVGAGECGPDVKSDSQELGREPFSVMKLAHSHQWLAFLWSLITDLVTFTEFDCGEGIDTVK